MIQYGSGTLTSNLGALWSQRERGHKLESVLVPFNPLVLNVNLTQSLVWVLTLLRFLSAVAQSPSLSSTTGWLVKFVIKTVSELYQWVLGGMFEEAWPFPNSCFSGHLLTLGPSLAPQVSWPFRFLEDFAVFPEEQIWAKRKNPKKQLQFLVSSLVPSPDWLWTSCPLSTRSAVCVCLCMWKRERQT